MRRHLVFALLLAGCQSGPVATVDLATQARFDPQEAAFIRAAGKTKISGHAFWRDGEGGAVNAAGEIVRLVPATAYARERFRALYRGGRSIGAYGIERAAADPGYEDYTRTTRAESNGRFEFENVAPGTYFVATQMVWKDKHQFFHFQVGTYNNYQKFGKDGGAMYETVVVTGKETEAIKLVLTNDL